MTARLLEEKIKAQKKYTTKHGLPHFAPHSGKCSCGKQIYEKIDIETASSSLITGCPHCNRSYCD